MSCLTAPPFSLVDPGNPRLPKLSFCKKGYQSKAFVPCGAVAPRNAAGEFLGRSTRTRILEMACTGTLDGWSARMTVSTGMHCGCHGSGGLIVACRDRSIVSHKVCTCGAFLHGFSIERNKQCEI